jgi:hypothetical protein
MWIIQEPKKVALWNKWHFEEKNGVCAACLKYSGLIFIEKIYKTQHLEGSSTPVLYIGRTVLKGEVPLHVMEAYRRSKGLAPFILNLYARCKWSTSRACRFTTRKKKAGTHWIRGCLGSGVGLDLLAERISSYSADSNTRSSSPSGRAKHDQTAHSQVHRIHIQIEGIPPHTNTDKWRSVQLEAWQVH